MSTDVQTPQPAPTPPSERRFAPPKLGPQHAALLAVLAGSLFLNTYRLSQNGFANVFYAAGIKSMLRSWHNFFFVSFDPGGLVSVDKPPVALWVMAISGKLFGFNSLSQLLPEAIAGVIAVAVLYGIVSRRFGPVAGIIAAASLAVFPSFAASARDNNVDTVLILLMLLACGAGLRATETGRLRWLVACAVCVGLAFNTKTLAAFLIVPGIAAAYLACAEPPVLKRVLQLLLAGAVMVVVSGAWIVYVDGTSASQRPYVGSSTDNSEVNLTFQYNGVGRVGGQTGGPGRVPHIEQKIGLPTTAGAAPIRRIHIRHRAVAVNPHPLVTFGGPTGPFRLFDGELGDQGGWMLPFAVVALLAVALLSARRRRDPRLAALLVLGGWFAVEAVVLSFGKGIIHPYYVSALGPGTAAMVGAGAVALAELAQRGSWQRVLPALALAATVIVQAVMLARDHFDTWDIALAVVVCGVCALLPLVLRSRVVWVLGAAVAALSVAPAAMSATTWRFPVEGTFPAVGPTASAGHAGVGLPAAGVRWNRLLLEYVESHDPGSRWSVLTDAASVAAPMILLGADAGAVGGYSGTDPALDGPSLGRLVAAGEARYLLMGGVYWDRGGNGATRAVVNVCKAVPPALWHEGAAILTATQLQHLSKATPKPSPVSFALYDCRGDAQALAAFSSAG